MRYPPEEAEKVTGVPAEAIRATAREYASRAARGDLLHPRHHGARLRRRQHLVALEPRPHDRPPRLRVDGAQRASRPEQRPGPQRLGGEPVLPAGLPVRRRPGDPAQVLRRVGRRGAGAARLPARPDRLGPARRPDQGALPHRREPCADRAERAPRRGRAGRPRVPDVAGHLPQRLDPEVRARRASRVELRGEGRDVHEHRAADQPRADGGAAPGRGEGRPRDRHPHGEGTRRGMARLPGRRGRLERARRPLAQLVRHPLRPPRGERDAVAVHRTSTIRGRRTCTRPGRRCRQDADASSRSSSSRRSRSPTPSTRSCSRPAARSTTTTRRT